MAIINIGLVGAGTVGGGVVKVFQKQKEFFRKSLGLSLNLKRIVDIDPARFKELPTGDALCTENADDIINDKDIQIVVELVGGTTVAKTVQLRALTAKKHVISANKALLAEHGPEIFETAEKNNVSVFFEASVGGGMPVIKTSRESLVANDILSVKTIINGTCNYILSQMTEKGLPFDDVLKAAQKKGYAEADPTLDIGGGDTGHKVSIIASLLYGGYVPFHKIYIEGITEVTAEDIAFAKELGYSIKLLGIIKRDPGSAMLDVRVHPTMLHRDHILSSVTDVFNAILIEGDAVGPVVIYGKGAGEMPTASAVVGDIIDVARNIAGGSPKRVPMNFYSVQNELSIQPITTITTRYYLRFSVVDKPKVLATISSVLGEQGISIASVMQKEGYQDDFVPVIILTHEATESSLQKAIATIEKTDIVKRKTQIIRIEE